MFQFFVFVFGFFVAVDTFGHSTSTDKGNDMNFKGICFWDNPYLTSSMHSRFCCFCLFTFKISSGKLNIATNFNEFFQRNKIRFRMCMTSFVNNNNNNKIASQAWFSMKILLLMEIKEMNSSRILHAHRYLLGSIAQCW